MDPLNPPAELNGLTEIIATMLTVAITSAGRPFLTLFLLFGVPTALMEAQIWGADDWFFPPVHIGVIIGLGALAVVEHFMRGSELYAELVEQFPWDRLPVIVTVWLLFLGGTAHATEVMAATTGLPIEASMWDPASWEPVSWHPRTWLSPAGALLVGTIVVNFAVGWARNRVFEVARDLGVGGIAHWLEMFGVVGLIVLVVMIPVGALGITAIAAGIVFMLALMGRLIEATIDRGRRRACPSCGHMARAEAQRCPSCGSTLSVERRLAAVTG